MTKLPTRWGRKSQSLSQQSRRSAQLFSDLHKLSIMPMLRAALKAQQTNTIPQDMQRILYRQPVPGIPVAESFQQRQIGDVLLGYIVEVRGITFLHASWVSAAPAHHILTDCLSVERASIMSTFSRSLQCYHPECVCTSVEQGGPLC